jgi:hypothetical protein
LLHTKTYNNKGDLDDLDNFQDEEDVVTLVCQVQDNLENVMEGSDEGYD